MSPNRCVELLRELSEIRVREARVMEVAPMQLWAGAIGYLSELRAGVESELDDYRDIWQDENGVYRTQYNF